MASFASPLRTLVRARANSAFPVTASSLAGPSRLSPLPALSSARADLSTSTAFPATRRAIPRSLHHPIKRWNSSAAPDAAQKPLAGEDESDSGDSLRIEAPVPGAKPQPVGQITPRLSLTFTCTADDCGHRSTHEFTKQAYTKGIVLVQCPSCKNRHLIADHLGWFKESTDEGTLKTIEDLLRAKGETVRTGRVNWDGDIEYDGESKTPS